MPLLLWRYDNWKAVDLVFIYTVVFSLFVFPSCLLQNLLYVFRFSVIFFLLMGSLNKPNRLGPLLPAVWDSWMMMHLLPSLQMRPCRGRRGSGSRRSRSLSPSACRSLIPPDRNTSTSCASQHLKMTSPIHPRPRLSHLSFGWVAQKAWCGIDRRFKVCTTMSMSSFFHLSQWQHPILLITFSPWQGLNHLN